jgi:hypothetical protein
MKQNRCENFVNGSFVVGHLHCCIVSACVPTPSMICGSYNIELFVASNLRRNYVDDVKSQMEGVTRVYNDIDNKISDKGGVQNLFGMNRKIRQALESISIGELDSLLAEIHRAKEGLTRLVLYVL